MYRRAVGIIAAMATIALCSANRAQAWQEEDLKDVRALEAVVNSFGRITLIRETSTIGVSVASNPGKSLSAVHLPSAELVTEIRFEAAINDSGVESLFKAFPHVKILSIDKGCWSSRIGLEGIGLKKIEQLWANECELSPHDLKAIGQMETLEVLMLGGNKDGRNRPPAQVLAARFSQDSACSHHML